MLIARAKNEAVFDGIVAMVNDFKAYFTAHGERVSENPSPGNIVGGITTLEEKSLGAVQKADCAIVTDVRGLDMSAHAEAIPQSGDPALVVADRVGRVAEAALSVAG